MSSNSSTWLLISFISFQKLINHHNNLRNLYRKPEVCWWWTHWTDAVYTEASHQDQDSQYCGCDHLARSPAASTRLGWRCCQPRPQAATGTGPADTWQPLHSTGHTPPRHPAPALDVVMAGLVWWCVSAVVPRLGCECGDDGRPRQSRGQRRPATGTGGLLIAGHCPPVSHCLPQHQNTIRLLYFFWASYFICSISIHSIFIKWSQRTQINKYTTIIGTQTDGWWRSGEWMFVGI